MLFTAEHRCNVGSLHCSNRDPAGRVQVVDTIVALFVFFVMWSQGTE